MWGLPCFDEDGEYLMGEVAKVKLTQIPLLNDTFSDSIEDLSKDILAQVVADFKLGKIQPSTWRDHRRFQPEPTCCICALCERRWCWCLWTLILCTSQLNACFEIENILFHYSKLKGSVSVHLKLVGFSTSNKVKNRSTKVFRNVTSLFFSKNLLKNSPKICSNKFEAMT